MFEVIEKDVFDDSDTGKKVATADTWKKACDKVDEIRDQRTPRQNMTWGLEIREVGGRP